MAADPYQKAVLDTAKFLRRPVLKYFYDQFNPAKKIVILLPGGAGSTLRRADKEFNQVSSPSEYGFDTVWLTPGIFIGDGNKLPISKNGRDLLQRVIVPDGDIQYFVKAYVKAMRFFRANCNAVLLGWDWRRDVMLAVEMVNAVIGEIKRKKGQQVLKNIFLVGHSMGGMVAKLFFSIHGDTAREIGGMISVGTPFYGYIGQLQRIYEGEDILNDFYTAKRVAEIYSTFGGLYSLFQIDYDTFIRDKGTLGLANYPVTEPKGGYADAYQKSTSPPYPHWVRPDELPPALSLRNKLAERLPEDLRQKVFHVRALMHETSVAAEWDQNLPDPYDPPKSRSPIRIGPEHLGKGDEVIPYWSARLASTDDKNVHDFTSGTGEHMTLMAQDYVLRRILRIVTGTSPLTKEEFIAEYGPNPQVATRDELNAFMADALPKIRLLSPKSLREFEALIPERYLWRMLQEVAL